MISLTVVPSIEIYKTVMSMNGDRAAVPDGFNRFFYSFC